MSILWHCLSLGLEWKRNFSSPMATAEFFKFADILSAALSQHHLSGFENSSTGIPSSPLALFVVMIPKAHLTSHSRMPGPRWVITPSWLSGSWRPFLYSSSVYSCHLFLISAASIRSLLFSVLYHAHPFMKCSLDIANFLGEISRKCFCGLFCRP